MSAAPAERPHRSAPAEHPKDSEASLLDEANPLTERLPGYRIEIIKGQIRVTPPVDGAHGRGLTDLMLPFIAA
ncbi:hypothetical protein [Streptomyces sp. NPDC048361]|uniref:hypothetical protein n=1 Tax=Streptomyces sp. NPDC048361 TaxID=3154720 RepID=UPI00343549CD